MQLVDKYKPETLADFVGAERPKKILSAFVAKPYTSAWLLEGPSGTGKTTMAFAAARMIGASPEIGGGIYHVPARKCDLERIDSIVKECQHRPMFGGTWNVVIVDEADRMTLPAQHALLSKLDCADAPPTTIWFFTANETTGLEDRFLSRCRRLQFSTDGLLEPGIELLRRVFKAETKGKAKVPAPDLGLILRTARFNLREALMLLETEILCPGSLCEAASATPSRPKGITVIGKGNGTGRIYTIGCNGLAVDDLQTVLRSLNVNQLIDCCWKPRRQFRQALGESYLWAGDRLSGGRTDAATREQGYKWLLGLVADGTTAMLMYPEEDPARCNRHHVIAVSLLERGVDITHVFGEELIQASEFQSSIDEDREYTPTTWRLKKSLRA